MSDPFRSDPSLVYVAHGPRRDLWTAATVYPAAVLALLVAASAAVPRFGRAVGVGGIATVVAVTLLLSVVVVLLSRTEMVVLSPQGISCTKLARPLPDFRHEVRWEWLDPVPRGMIRFGFVQFRWHKPGGYLEWFLLEVSPAHARAILAHPACPKGSIPPEVTRQLARAAGTL
jgi:hypothetical protein